MGDGGARRATVRGLGLEVRAGEIVGIAGVAGEGQSELMEALSGERLIRAEASLPDELQQVGSIEVEEADDFRNLCAMKGRDCFRNSEAEAIRRRGLFVPLLLVPEVGQT